MPRLGLYRKVPEENTGNRCILINDMAEATDTDFPGAARAVTTSAIPSPSVKAGLFSEHHRAPTVASLSGPVPQAYTRGDRKKYSRSRTTCNPGRGKKGRQGAASVSIADVLVWLAAVSCSHGSKRSYNANVKLQIPSLTQRYRLASVA